MSDLVCQHGDLFELCLDCTVAPPAPTATPPVVGEYQFEAQYPGTCSACDGRFDIDDPIVRMSNETYQHLLCVGRWAA